MERLCVLCCRYQTENVWKIEAAERLQCMVRGYFGRKKALVAAKKAAYAEAKTAAIKVRVRAVKTVAAH